MDIHRDRNARTISLAQSRMMADLLDKYSMAECEPSAVPLNTATKLTKNGAPLDTATNYSQLIGNLMYLSVCTCSDVAQAVGALARYMATPTEMH